MSRLSSHVIALLALVILVLGGAAPAAAASTSDGAVYTITNSASGNAVVVYSRSTTGALSWSGTFATGGLGTGAGLGSQGSVIVSEDGQWLYAVDAGSNDIATFAVKDDALALVGRVWSGGTQPISLTANGRAIYVVNNGSLNIAGFRASHEGLAPIAGSARALLGAGPAQIQFSPSGNALVVTDKATSTIETFVVDTNDVAGAPQSFVSSGSTPFGFAFAHHDRLVVSEAAGAPAGLSAASSYQLGKDGSLSPITRSAPTTQAAACWVVVTKNGRYAYTANAASDSISAFAIDEDGGLTLVAAQAAHSPGAHTTDMATSHNSRFLYALDNSTHMISAFRVDADGLLTRLPGTAVAVGAAGLAAR